MGTLVSERVNGQWAFMSAILIFNFDQKFSSLFDGPNDNLSGVKGAHYI